MRSMNASQAYRQSAAQRGLREQEADVFLRVNGVLRNAMRADSIARSKAVADNERLWISVMDLVRDPANQLPPPLRASILSIGHTIRRECAGETPDIDFLIGINDQIAAGLSRSP